MNNKMKNNGFTLIELMVTLAIATIITLIAVPSFTTLIKNNRIITSGNIFISALSYARSEATKRAQTITVASNSGTTSWEGGWEVRQGATVIRVYEALPTGNTLTNTAGSAATVLFDSRGGLSGATSLTFRLCDDRTGETGVEISINVTGRPASSDYTCS